ncbi:hypothetical protein AVEN_96609-1 [Araneus ventricosus]|uniref:AMP-dependent synthetase/ligase domain-containing protein n=1 Tax=Araneus ventricosus TaxID=182803 RepID=A0A4Y2L0H2_ARAVE|nr:hypothetical protein AVEN_96609-1 [Araneus ventricosus]
MEPAGVSFLFEVHWKTNSSPTGSVLRVPNVAVEFISVSLLSSTRLFGVGWVTWNMTTTLLSLGFTLLLFEGVPYYISRTYFWDLIDEFRVTNLFLPTGVVDEFYKRQLVPTEKHNLDSLKVVLAGGSVVKPQIYDFIYKKVKKDVKFCASYGSTELMGSCLILETMLPIHQGESNAVSLGDQLEILDEKG